MNSIVWVKRLGCEIKTPVEFNRQNGFKIKCPHDFYLSSEQKFDTKITLSSEENVYLFFRTHDWNYRINNSFILLDAFSELDLILNLEPVNNDMLKLSKGSILCYMAIVVAPPFEFREVNNRRFKDVVKNDDEWL